jgi:hypothetical protein
MLRANLSPGDVDERGSDKIAFVGKPTRRRVGATELNPSISGCSARLREERYEPVIKMPGCA